jgi:hypothetical protein
VDVAGVGATRSATRVEPQAQRYNWSADVPSPIVVLNFLSQFKRKPNPDAKKSQAFGSTGLVAKALKPDDVAHLNLV